MPDEKLFITKQDIRNYLNVSRPTFNKRHAPTLAKLINYSQEDWKRHHSKHFTPAQAKKITAYLLKPL